MKLWQKGYEPDKRAEAFTVGNDYLLDQKLVKYDCLASIAHAKTLEKAGLLSGVECGELVTALNEIIELDNVQGFRIDPDDEDCHTAIENYLTEKLGDVGKKIHTGRSRNDQVLAALRLYCKDEVHQVIQLADGLVKALSLFTDGGKVEMPGYTHMRKAMPSSIALWAGAFIESMEDNKTLLLAVAGLADQSPLGSGAGYGLPMEIDRGMTAKLLGFGKVQGNPLYVQNSRGKFESSILHALTQIMLDLNKMATDVLLFSLPELGYFELPQELLTGSSMMPHKKNPDVLELLRAKYHQVVSCEFEMKNLVGNLPSGYNRDLQLTKEPLMKGFEITKASLGIATLVVEKLKVNVGNCKKAMTGELYSFERAYALVKEGTPFRDAYRQVGTST